MTVGKPARVVITKTVTNIATFKAVAKTNATTLKTRGQPRVRRLVAIEIIATITPTTGVQPSSKLAIAKKRCGKGKYVRTCVLTATGNATCSFSEGTFACNSVRQFEQRTQWLDQPHNGTWSAMRIVSRKSYAVPRTRSAWQCGQSNTTLTRCSSILGKDDISIIMDQIFPGKVGLCRPRPPARPECVCANARHAMTILHSQADVIARHRA